MICMPPDAYVVLDWDFDVGVEQQNEKLEVSG
jgi:hypothetical protein